MIHAPPRFEFIDSGMDFTHLPRLLLHIGSYGVGGPKGP